MFPPPPPFYVANTWQTEGREVPDLLTCWGQLKIIHAFLFSRIGLKRGNWALSHCTFDLASFLCAQNWDQVSTPSINEWNWPKYFLEDENCDRIKGEQTASRGFKHRLCSPVLCCAESCSTLCDPMYCSSPGSSIYGISLAKIPSPGNLSDPGNKPKSAALDLATLLLVMDREAWRTAIHGVAKSHTRLSDWTERLGDCNNSNNLETSPRCSRVSPRAASFKERCDYSRCLCYKAGVCKACKISLVKAS